MMVFLAQLAEGGGTCPLPTPFHSIYHLHSSYVALSYPSSEIIATYIQINRLSPLLSGIETHVCTEHALWLC
jgi:hypothetical protein